VRGVSSLQDLWAVHRNITSAEEQNAAEELTANLDLQNDAGHMIRVSVDARKREFTVTNDRNGKSRNYQLK